ncbi:methyl-accepting chemotaxis protein [Celeribacter arenosi]|uniref:Methyl-accepting chemotaxis protein n=1 Tax=Celeribacter arenosi TaxID=792649 RepID=A0ABP7KH97_9RHOB
MKIFYRVKLAKKLPAIMIGLTALAIIIANVVSYRGAAKMLLVQAEEGLQSVAESRALEISSWFDMINIDVRSQSENPTVMTAIRGFGEAWRSLPRGDKKGYLQNAYIDENPHETGQKHNLDFADDGSAYSQVHKIYHSYFRKLVEEKDYRDVFVFNTAGELIYSVAKARDFASDFTSGELSETGLGRVIQQSLADQNSQIYYSDFEAYGPFNGAPAAFVATPVRDRNGKIVGAIGFQMSNDRIDTIVNRRIGLGENGDNYLVGMDGLLRSNRSRGTGDDVIKTRDDTEAVRLALSGEAGVLVAEKVDPDTGNVTENAVAYMPFKHHHVTWAFVAEQPVSDILAPARQLRTTMLWQGALMILVVAGIAYLIARAISRPLTRVEKSMLLVSDGDYDTSVPETDRADEIGGIAKALDAFRAALGRAQSATRDGLFKGAAFEGSSAALMMVDRDFNITYLNSAANDLMQLQQDTFRSHIASFDPDGIVGTNIDMFHAHPERVRAILSDKNNLPYSTDLKVGRTYFSISVNAVSDANGEQIGCVMEWKDVTAIRTNAAIISALEADQAKAEFDLDGCLVAANSNFTEILGETPETLQGRSQAEIFDFDPVKAEKHGAIWDRVHDGESIYGRFNLRGKDGAASMLDGTFSPIKDANGKPVGLILVGNDVTESQTALREAEELQLRTKVEQDKVVDGLRVGLKRLAEGDLMSRIETPFAPEYETLRSDFNLAMENLFGAMRSVVENADMIRGEASEISNAADDLSRRTEKQAATLEETATALDELTSSVKSAADGAHHASDMVKSAKTNAENSGQIVQEAVEAMSQIETSSNQISKITSVIDDIAFQTNLLALNAGVEAARAGEAGRGFAVVASEVRALAQRSSDAAREINDLISKSGVLVKRGVGLVGETGDALRGIVTSVTEIANNVSEIAVSSKEQSAGLAEINASVNQLDQVTQQNAAMFEETTAASHALTREAENLTVTTSRFSIGAANAANSTAPVHVDFKAAKAAEIQRAAGPAVKQTVNAPTPKQVVEDDWEDF